VTDPAGNEWELYVSRIEAPQWKEGNPSGFGDDGPSAFDGPLFLLDIPLAVVGFLWSSIVVPLLRFAVLMPFAVVRGRRSHAARIDAICFYPDRETRTWTTTIDQVDSVLDEIAKGLEAGKIPQPAGAVYSGSETG
jgi:hypothetical protein